MTVTQEPHTASVPSSCPSTPDKKVEQQFLQVPCRTKSWRTAKTPTKVKTDTYADWHTRFRARSRSPSDSDQWRSAFRTPSPSPSSEDQLKAKDVSPMSNLRFRLVAAPQTPPPTAADCYQAPLDGSRSQSACSSLANSPMPSPKSRVRRSSDPTHQNWRISRRLQFYLLLHPHEPRAVRHPLGGMLRSKAVEFFCQAYGLNGHARRTHQDIIKQAMEETGCSERAIIETLYGHSYAPLLQQYRDIIPGYTPKVSCRLRNRLMEEIMADIESHDFYHYDGNNASVAAPATVTAPATATTETSS